MNEFIYEAPMLIEEILNQFIDTTRLKILIFDTGRKIILQNAEELPQQWSEELHKFMEINRTIDIRLHDNTIYLACHMMESIKVTYLDHKYTLIDKSVLDLHDPNSIQELKRLVEQLCPSTNS